MKRFFSAKPFKNKLFLSYAVVGFCVVLIFGAFLIITTSRLNREREIYQQQQLHSANVSELEQVFNQVDLLASQVIANNELLNFFVLLSSDPSNANYFEDNLLDGIRAESILASINGTDAFAARICIYNQFGDFVSTGPLYETQENVSTILADTQTILDTMNLLETSAQRRLILGPAADRWSNNPKTRTFTVLRAFSPPYSTKVFAVLSIELDINIFSEHSFFDSAASGIEYLLLGNDGSMIYAADETRDIQFIAPQLLALAGAEGDAQAEAATGYLTEKQYQKTGDYFAPGTFGLVCVLPDSLHAAKRTVYGQLLSDGRCQYCIAAAVAVGNQRNGGSCGTAAVHLVARY